MRGGTGATFVPREVAHCEPFATVRALLVATHDFLEHCGERAARVRAILGAAPQSARS